MYSIQLAFFPYVLNYEPGVSNDLRLLGTELEELYSSKENENPPYPTASEVAEALPNIRKAQHNTAFVRSTEDSGTSFIKYDGLQAIKPDNPLTDIIINISRLQGPITRLSKRVSEITKPELEQSAFPSADHNIISQIHKAVTQVA